MNMGLNNIIENQPPIQPSSTPVTIQPTKLDHINIYNN